jgi:hypothetical protein
MWWYGRIASENRVDPPPFAGYDVPDRAIAYLTGRYNHSSRGLKTEMLGGT